MNEEKLEKEFEVYKQLASQDKKIDVASLMINALQKHQTNFIEPKLKRWAYFVSLIIPPFGLLFAIKFYLSEKDDANSATIICIVLTAISILLTYLFTKAIFSTGPGLIPTI